VKHSQNRTVQSGSSEIELLESVTKGYEIETDSWRVLRIQSEIVDGFENLKKLEHAVSMFGSARIPDSDPLFHQAYNMARDLSLNGISVISGGGPGLMRAFNKGAQSGKKGISVGLNIELPHEQAPNEFQDIGLEFRYFFVRKLMFVRYACAYMFFPGGFGTLDEFYDVVTLIQTRKIKHSPVILMGKDYWSGLLGWMKGQLVGEHFIDARELSFIHLLDDQKKALEIVKKAMRE
jgi:uncharacterized protein (TIGR00730 family)